MTYAPFSAGLSIPDDSALARVQVRHPEDLGGSMAFYPIVGAALGTVMLGVYVVGSEVFPDGVSGPRWWCC